MSFTTTPRRLSLIMPMVSSIAYQTRKPDRFVLWLPLKYEKENSEYDLTDSIKKQLLGFGVEIVRCEKDYGPATKLIPMLKSETDSDTLIVTVDDDVFYEKHILEMFEKASVRYSFAALGLVGLIKKQFVHGEELPRLNMEVIGVEVLGGYRGVAYRRGLFDNSIFTDMEAMLVDGLFVADDHLISWNLMRRGIPRIVIRTMQGITPKAINSAMLYLGSGVYMGADKKGLELAHTSLVRLREM